MLAYTQKGTINWYRVFVVFSKQARTHWMHTACFLRMHSFTRGRSRWPPLDRNATFKNEDNFSLFTRKHKIGAVVIMIKYKWRKAFFLFCFVQPVSVTGTRTVTDVELILKFPSGPQTSWLERSAEELFFFFLPFGWCSSKNLINLLCIWRIISLHVLRDLGHPSPAAVCKWLFKYM